MIAAGVLAAGEIVTLTFVLGPLALAAIVGALVAVAGGGVVLQVLAFALAALASLLVLRPVARHHLRQPAALRSGTAALAGSSAVVLERVDGHGGRVKIGGEVWSARAYDEDRVIEPGVRVVVLEIRGATALVAE
jgi:membrane protein implicated in regulation of membrane protease activity